MPIDEQRIEEIFADIYGDSIRDGIPMRLGNPNDGKVAIPISEIGIPGMVWVHGVSGENLAPGGEESLATDDKGFITSAMLKPNKIPPGLQVYGAPVVVVLKKGIYMVEDLDGYAAVEFFHDFREREQRSTDISQLDFFLIRPTKPVSHAVEVSGGVVVFKGRAYRVPLLRANLESSIPSTTGKARAVKIEVDPVSATLNLELSVSTFDNAVSHYSVFETYYPKTVSADRILVGWVKLFEGMPAINITDILHAQELINKPPTLENVVTCFGLPVISEGVMVYA